MGSFRIISKSIQITHIVSPVLLDLDKGLEHDLLAKESLDVLACQGAELAEHRTLFANEDSLLTVALTEDDGRDVDELLALLEALYSHLARVRNLLVVELQDLLADDLGDEETSWFVGELIFIEVRRTLWQELLDLAHQDVGAEAMERRDRDDLCLWEALMPLLHFLDKLGLGDEVHLIEHHDDLWSHRSLVFGHLLHFLQEDLILLRTLNGIGQVKQYISILQSSCRESQHRLMELGHRLEDTRSIAVDNLHVFGIDNTHDAMTGGLRLVGDDTDTLTDEGIHQCGLADVWVADDIYET